MIVAHDRTGETLKMLHDAGKGNFETLLDEDQVAGLLNLSVRTLQAWRIRGQGPAFVRCGRAIRYRPADVSRWMDARTVVAKEAV